MLRLPRVFLLRRLRSIGGGARALELFQRHLDGEEAREGKWREWRRRGVEMRKRVRKMRETRFWREYFALSRR
jgi:hypothetical protein